MNEYTTNLAGAQKGFRISEVEWV